MKTVGVVLAGVMFCMSLGAADIMASDKGVKGFEENFQVAWEGVKTPDHFFAEEKGYAAKPKKSEKRAFFKRDFIEVRSAAKEDEGSFREKAIVKDFTLGEHKGGLKEQVAANFGGSWKSKKQG